MKSSPSSTRLMLWLSIAGCLVWTIHAQTAATTMDSVTVVTEAEVPAEVPTEADDVPTAAPSVDAGPGNTTQAQKPGETPKPEPEGKTEKPKNGGCVHVASITLLTVVMGAIKLV